MTPYPASSYLEDAEMEAARARLTESGMILLHVSQVERLTQEIRTLRSELRSAERRIARAECHQSATRTSSIEVADRQAF